MLSKMHVRIKYLEVIKLLGGFVIYKTKKIISNNFLKLISKKQLFEITNNEIISKSNISKSTFYNNFNDKLDIVQFIFEEIDKDIFIQFKNIDYDINDLINYFSNIIIPIIYEKREIIKVLYTSSLKGYWINFLEKRYSAIIYKKIYSDFKKRIFIKYVISIIELWITDDIPDEPIEFKKDFLNYLNRNIIDIQKESK